MKWECSKAHSHFYINRNLMEERTWNFGRALIYITEK